MNYNLTICFTHNILATLLIYRFGYYTRFEIVILLIGYPPFTYHLTISESRDRLKCTV